MVSISKIITSQPTLNNLSKEQPAPSIKITKDTSVPAPTKALTSSNLQSDDVVISKESQEKLAAENKLTKEDKTKLTAEQQAKISEDKNESSIDEEIRELSIKILELTLQIELLKSKEDTESKKR